MRIYQLVVPAHAPDVAALSRAAEWLKRARCSISKSEGVSRRDIAVIGPRRMYRSGRMIGLVYRLYHDPVADVDVVMPGDAPPEFDLWAEDAKEI